MFSINDLPAGKLILFIRVQSREGILIPSRENMTVCRGRDIRYRLSNREERKR